MTPLLALRSDLNPGAALVVLGALVVILASGWAMDALARRRDGGGRRG